MSPQRHPFIFIKNKTQTIKVNTDSDYFFTFFAGIKKNPMFM